MTSNDKKIWGIRAGLIGDTLMSLPILQVLSEEKPEYYKYFVIEQKCKQASPLYYNHPNISEIIITENSDGILTDDEMKIRDSCEIAFNIAPPHPLQQDWYNYRSCIEETALMAGFDIELVKNIKPKLFKWFEYEKKDNTICIFPFAGYNKWHSRNPTKEWWKITIENIIKNGFKVIHCGYTNEPDLCEDSNYHKITNLEFFEQIKIAYGCRLTIGTDSGSMWVIGAYGLPQINLLTNHMNNNHIQNFLALAPTNSNNLEINLFGLNGCNNIQNDQVIEAIRTITE